MADEIVPGIFRIELPLPRNPLKAVNCYVIPGEHRSLIIDTGMNRTECREVLERELESLDLDLAKTDVLVTHLHADHLGLAPFITKGRNEVMMGEKDINAIKESDYWSSMLENALKHGFPNVDPQEAISKHPGYKYGPLGEMKLAPLRGGEVLEYGGRSLKAVHTPGHSRGHLCLYDRKDGILFSGDHILGDITPNISAWSQVEDPLSTYVSSLLKTRKMEVELTLPGHGSPILDHRKRIDELIHHHGERAQEVLDIIDGSEMDAMTIASRMTWDMSYDSFEEFPVMQKWFALGEAIAHIRFLESKSEVKRSFDGKIFRFSAL
ncbi:MAG: MBL fold metallo-hydrolase [Thermoplasmatota archaeon]